MSPHVRRFKVTKVRGSDSQEGTDHAFFGELGRRTADSLSINFERRWGRGGHHCWSLESKHRIAEWVRIRMKSSATDAFFPILHHPNNIQHYGINVSNESNRFFIYLNINTDDLMGRTQELLASSSIKFFWLQPFWLHPMYGRMYGFCSDLSMNTTIDICFILNCWELKLHIMKARE